MSGPMPKGCVPLHCLCGFCGTGGKGTPPLTPEALAGWGDREGKKERRKARQEAREGSTVSQEWGPAVIAGGGAREGRPSPKRST